MVLKLADKVIGELTTKDRFDTMTSLNSTNKKIIRFGRDFFSVNVQFRVGFFYSFIYFLIR